MKRQILTRALAVLALIVSLALTSTHAAPLNASELAKGFANPPAEARPWVYWFWLNGNITSNGITADLEAMKRVGIGGVLIMEVDQGAPKGPAAFGGPQWRALFQHVCAEAHRLGLEVNMNNDAGWCGSGGPWITPELAMQKVVWSETNVTGPFRFDGKLSQPQKVSNYYGDIAVLAFPTPSQDTRIENIQAKAAFVPQRIAPDGKSSTMSGGTIACDRIVNLTEHLGTNGDLRWEVPEGRWTILRLGHTLTGKDNHPAPEPGRGLESDKLSRAATDVMFAGLMGKLIADSKPLAGNTLVATHIDSWETGSQNWTPLFRQDFKRLRGYDPLPFLPVMTGRIVDSLEVSERFLWDLRQSVSDLLVQNYAGRFRELAHKNGLRLSIEAYDAPPCDEMTYGGQADEPMAEFWSWGYNAAYSCTEMASAAHVYGKRILGAEAFTATDGEKWLHHPASIKALGDWAFCEGINRFVFHRYALQPWLKVEPGMSMGPWGLHYERTQTWWEQSSAWHEYLARCQFLLRQGLFVADICYLQPEGSPQRFTLTLPGNSANTPDRPQYNFDGCTPEVVLTRMKVKDGKLVLPDGMSYQVLVLPEVETMTPRLLRKIEELVKAGATVVGGPPAKSPSLSHYPACDLEVKKLADELWGAPAAASLQYSHTPTLPRSVGKGRVIWNGEFNAAPAKAVAGNPLTHAKWIWYPEGHPAVAAPVGPRYFRRVITLETNRTIASARAALTADNGFELWINGRQAGSGEDFNQIFNFNVASLLKPGVNLIAVAANNGGETPNPAGLIAALSIQFTDGPPLELVTDRQWKSAVTARDHWTSEADSGDAWVAAMELGPLGMSPWNVPGNSAAPAYRFPDFETIASTLAASGLPPDFEADGHLRYIHRRTGDMDIYFVANPSTNWIGARCAFRVSGRTPEIWQPLTGEIKRQLVYEESHGRTFLPLWLEPAGSAFVVFSKSKDSPAVKSRMTSIVAVKLNGRSVLPERGGPEVNPPAIELFADSGKGAKALAWQSGVYELKTASGQTRQIEVPALPPPLEVSGPWEVHFQPNRGAPDKIAFESLTDWGRHANEGVKYFSGTATYTKTITPPAGWLAGNRRCYLDLGRVAVIAQVKLNGKNLGILWKPPFRVDVTDALRGGENRLEVKVVNLWINRMIGDEQLPEDSDRNPNGTLKEWPQWVNEGQPSPAGRFTFTSWRLWKKDSPLQESGLLGPVRLVTAEQVQITE